MATRRTLWLDEQQRQQLTYHRDHDSRPYVRERCSALLKVADGFSAHAVACSGLLRRRDPDTIYSWLDRFESGGLDSLFDHQHGGYRRHCF
jgi:hypothetical protein